MAGRILKITKGGGGGSPGGNNTEVQYNNAGAFGGCAQLFWDNTNDRLGLGDNAPAKQLSITKCIKMLESSDSGVGVIYKGVDRFIHDYKAVGSDGNNVFVGRDAGNFSMAIAGNSREASNNVGIGYGSLTSVTTGYRNLGMGYRTMAAVTTGYENCVQGYAALYSNATGSKNVAIGCSAGRGVAGHSIRNNVLVGAEAGVGLRSGGDHNIIIGCYAGDNMTSGERNIIIGYNLNALAAAGDYQLNIGSLIFGDLGGTKKVGINTSTMNETLNVGGAIRLGTSALTNDGTVRWTGTDFEGYMTGWKSLTILKGLNEIFTTRGDIIYRGAADPTRLAAGTNGAFLRSNGAGSDPSWYEPCTTVGDLMVHDVAGYVVRLAAGANNHVLTANGAGAKPTWQAAQGGATKEFFAPVMHSGVMGNKGMYAAANITTSSHYAYINFRVPHDFSSITSAAVVVIPLNTLSSANWDVYSNYAAAGQAYNTHSQSNTASIYSVTVEQIFEVNIASILTSLAANDYVGIRFSAPIGADVDVLGVKFKYS